MGWELNTHNKRKMEYTIHLTRVYRGTTIHTTTLCCEARKHSLNCSNINHTGVKERSRTLDEHVRGQYETRNPTAPVLETTHNTQRATHNYSRAAKVLTFLRRGTSNRASRLILIVVYVRLSCVCLWAEWPLAYFSTAAYLLHCVSSSSYMTSIRLYIVSGRCFSKIIIFFFSFSSTFSKYGVLGWLCPGYCSPVSLLQWSSTNLSWILQLSTLFWFIDYRWWHILHTCHVSTHIFFLLAVRKPVVTWPSPPSQQSHPA